MALSPLFLSPSSSPLLARRRRSPVTAAASGIPSLREERVVIVGAGIAGLATAVSLHRLGVKSVVLEQGESLRTGGTSLTLFKNGWRVLDAIGIGDELREQFMEIEGMAIRSRSGRELRSFSFDEEAPGQEVRAVERRVLLETLAGKLPSGTICYSSRLENMQREVNDNILLELDNGQKLLAKTVIGCDGIRSPVAKWMGFSEPHYVGHSAFRGLGIYPEGQPFKPAVNYIYGRGLRAGYVPVSSTKVYWFICFNSASPGPGTTDPSSLKNEAQELVKGWPSELADVIDRTADSSVIKTPLVDRWLWPFISPPASSRGVVVVGDAWHPMTPNLGQGACCALEDAVVLSRNLAAALDSDHPGRIDEALAAYCRERWNRVFPLTVRANLVGSLLQWEDRAVCAIRDNIMIPKVVRIGPLLEHTNYECELPEPVTGRT